MHHTIELSMKKQPGGKVCNFQEFVEVVQRAGTNMSVIQMKNIIFKNWKGQNSEEKMKKAGVLLWKMVAIQFQRGSFGMGFKKSHADQQFQVIDFAKATIKTMKTSQLRPRDRGVAQDKKNDILTKLVPLMPSNRHTFWKDLPVARSDAEVEEEY